MLQLETKNSRCSWHVILAQEVKVDECSAENIILRILSSIHKISRPFFLHLGLTYIYSRTFLQNVNEREFNMTYESMSFL